MENIKKNGAETEVLVVVSKDPKLLCARTRDEYEFIIACFRLGIGKLANIQSSKNEIESRGIINYLTIRAIRPRDPCLCTKCANLGLRLRKLEEEYTKLKTTFLEARSGD